MHHTALKFSAFLFFVFLCLTAKGQDRTFRFRSMGILTGYGWDVQIKEKYRPVFIAGDFCWQIGRGAKKNFFAFYIEPQFNLVQTDNGTNYEAGSNIGLRYIKNFSSQTYLYAMVGSGPHYMSATIPRQAKGFLFSDNLGIGLMRKLNPHKSLALHIQFIARHISNANLVMPNGGINNLNVRIGLSGIR
jgi:hypothetical protein